MHKMGTGILFVLTLAARAQADSIGLWNFNDVLLGITGGAKEFLVNRGIGTMTSDFNAANIGNLGGSVINSQDGDPAGRALNLAGSVNNGKTLTWMVSTAGFKSIQTSLAIQRTSTGFIDNKFLYSIDSGASWIVFTPSFSPATSFALQAFDLRGIPALNNNPGAGFRIIFGGASSATGNNRIDNLLVSGAPDEAPPGPAPAPEPSTLVCAVIGLGGSFLARRITFKEAYFSGHG